MYSLDISKTITCSMFGKIRQTYGWDNKNSSFISSNLFIFMINGCAEFSFEDSTFNVEEGEILIIPAGVVYSAASKNSCEYYFFHFSGDMKQDFYLPDSKNTGYDFSFKIQDAVYDRLFFNLKISDGETFKKIYQIILDCEEYKLLKNNSGHMLINNEFFRIMLILSDVYDSKHLQLPIVLEKMIAYVLKNLTKPIRLSHISRHCSISEPYAARLFKKYLHVTASEFINSQKLFYACELLRNTSMNINEISNYLGYCDVFYFSKLFKEKFGCSPSKFSDI